MIAVRWTPAAARDLEKIDAYLKKHHPSFRETTVQRIFASIGTLRFMPHLGRPTQKADVRELLFPPLPFVATYRIRTDAIVVVRIRHASRQ